MYYSQFGEDRILDKLFGGKSTGSCVEVGANDGVNDSTTFYFEQRGWRCILIEPNPDLCRAIASTRTARLFPCAASDAEGVATLHVAEGAGRAHGVSGLGSAEESHRRITGYGFAVRPIEVRTRPLDAVLAEAGLQEGQIDFISIDVEGHELQVLKGLSIDRWKPAVLIAEDNSRFQDLSVVRHLRSFGYVPFKRTGVNDWFAHQSNTRLVSRVGRLSWHFAALNALARARLRKIPGLLALRSALLGR